VLAVVIVSAELLVPLLVIVGGLNDAVAPDGRPAALNVTVWADPLTSGAVIVEDPDVPPWVAVIEPGLADTAKSLSGGGAPEALNRAMPAAQYIALGNVPEKLRAALDVRACDPVTTETGLGVAVLCCGSTVKPGEVTEMSCVLPWPAMNPTARSLAADGVTDPEVAELDVAEVPVAPSNGLVATTPLNSWTRSATVDAAVVTVTLLTDAASGAYQSSPSEY
jgi:hypothetical protein